MRDRVNKIKKEVKWAVFAGAVVMGIGMTIVVSIAKAACLDLLKSSSRRKTKNVNPIP